MSRARDMAIGASIVGAVFVAAGALGQWLFDRSVIYPR